MSQAYSEHAMINDRSSLAFEGAFSAPSVSSIDVVNGEVRNRAGSSSRHLLILGTRGIPARHGGFETFAQQLAPYLVADGWAVSVYCQEAVSASGQKVTEELWNGIKRVLIPSRDNGSVASIMYDFRCVIDACRRPGVILLLGYNTAIFAVFLRMFGRAIVINMDGLEWKRPKWSRLARLWLWFNERVAAKIGSTLVADHPEIKSHLAQNTAAAKIVMIPYGSPTVMGAPVESITQLGLEPRGYYVCISRIEPENSQLVLVQAFSAARRGQKLVMLGNLNDNNAYHRAVRAAASDEVVFVGAIYDHVTLASLRYHALAYCHGHTVGGTNPSLVEALGAGCAVIAHDNPFNRWTAGSDQFFFHDAAAASGIFDALSADPEVTKTARQAARTHHDSNFILENVLVQYERLLAAHLESQATAGTNAESGSLIQGMHHSDEEPALALQNSGRLA